MTSVPPLQVPFLTVLAGLLLAGCSDDGPGQGGTRERGPTRVITATVERQPLVDSIQALGTATANESVDIRPRIASLVERINFDEGQTVDAGDLLVELESAEIRAQLAVAEAALSESRSLYERNRGLSETRAISASNLEQLLARVRVDEAEVEAARARLANTRILAPFAGRVGLRRVSPGSFVSNTTVLTTLDDVRTIKLDFSVPELFVTVVGAGMQIEAASPVYPGRSFEGTVTSVDTRLDPVSRAVQVRAVIDNPDNALKPGMFMTVDLQRESGDVLVAPEQAIVPEGSRQFVFVVDGGVARKRSVELGRRLPGFVVIRNGLDEGDAIVTEGTGKVRDGSAVEATERAAASIDDPAPDA